MARIILIFFILIPVFLFGQLPPEKMSAPEYVGKFKEAAIREMEEGGVPASITLAQGLLESGNGNSPLARNANNHFGIKCHVGWEGETYIQDDDEANECFRKYKTVFDSYRDHSNFLRNRQRYAFLFELDPTDYKGWAKGLKKAGYATDPSYADRLIKLIEQYELHKIDEIA
ncbi:MAG: glucosaminidase domain-containing protein, partial [Bacteroidetes bacterium]|nr:glucosaminidase domain-containing protein [Bacteroidota bacterium]